MVEVDSPDYAWSLQEGFNGTDEGFVKGFYMTLGKNAISKALGKVTREMCPAAFPLADLFDYVTEFIFGKE